MKTSETWRSFKSKYVELWHSYWTVTSEAGHAPGLAWVKWTLRQGPERWRKALTCRPETAILRPLEVIWELGFGEGSQNACKNGSPCLNCANNVVCAKHTLSFWEPGIWAQARHRVSMWPPLTKDIGQWASQELPWQTAFHTCCHNLLPGEWSTSCAIYWDRSLGSLFLVLWTSPRAPFPFAEFAVCPLAVIYQNHENEYIELCESFYRIIEPRGDLGDLNTGGDPRRH